MEERRTGWFRTLTCSFFEVKRACHADRGLFQSFSGRRSFQARPLATEIKGEFKRDLFSDKLAAESSDTDSIFVLGILSFMSHDPHPRFVIGQIGEILGTLKDRELQG